MSDNALDAVIDKLQRTAAELRTGDLPPPRAAALGLPPPCSRTPADRPAMAADALRGGRPPCPVRYGEAVAILAGDGLYAEAFRLVLNEQGGEPAGILAALGELADATGV